MCSVGRPSAGRRSLLFVCFCSFARPGCPASCPKRARPVFLRKTPVRRTGGERRPGRSCLGAFPGWERGGRPLCRRRCAGGVSGRRSGNRTGHSRTPRTRCRQAIPKKVRTSICAISPGPMRFCQAFGSECGVVPAPKRKVSEIESGGCRGEPLALRSGTCYRLLRRLFSAPVPLRQYVAGRCEAGARRRR